MANLLQSCFDSAKTFGQYRSGTAKIKPHKPLTTAAKIGALVERHPRLFQ